MNRKRFWGWAICSLVLMAFVTTPNVSHATGYGDKTPKVTAEAEADAVSTSAADAASALDATLASNAQARNEGNNTEIKSHTENNSSNVVLVPNNNTESCVRVFGLAFGKNGESGALGVPWRSKACDFEQAADDAFAAGERENGWFWKCQSKNLYKTFKGKDETVEQAQRRCVDKMVGETRALQVIEGLKSDLAFLRNEQLIEREECKASRERLLEGCSKY